MNKTLEAKFPELRAQGRRSHGHWPRGFTLLEMLVVILIIGMLTGIVGPRLFGQLAQSEVTTTRAQLSALDKSLQAFRIDTGRFPTSEEGLSVLTTPPINEPRWRGPYLQGSLPHDSWGQAFHYRSPGANGRDYDLYSEGKGGSPVTLP